MFDTSAAVPSNVVANTLDSAAPRSSVAALPARAVLTDIPVSWSGADELAGSGVANYDVLVSTDGGAFSLWQNATTATSATYSGQRGHSYGFYSVARDNVGQLEAASAVADATVQVLDGLLVTSVTSDASGVAVRFNEALDPSTLNLYSTQTGGQGPADLTLVGAITAAVAGSMVLDADLMGLRFLKTGGPLAADTYTLTLRGAANGFVATTGDRLDGNLDGTPGGDLV